MTGGGDAPPAASGGEFLLSLLQKHHHQTPPQGPQPQPQAPLLGRATPITPPPAPAPPQQQQQQQQQQPQQSLSLDPAVAAVGPTVPFLPPWQPSNGRDLPGHPWPNQHHQHHHHISSPLPPHFIGLPQNHWIPGTGRNQPVFGDDLQRLGFPSSTTTDVRGNSNSNSNSNSNYSVRNPVQQQEQKIVFGSLNGNSLDNWQLNAAAKERELGLVNGLDRNRRGKQHQIGNYRSTQPPPPGFSSKPRGGGGGGGGGNWDIGGDRRRGFEYNVEKEKGNYSDFSKRNVYEDDNKVRTPAVGSSLGSASTALGVEESGMDLHLDDDDDDGVNEDDFGQKLVDSLLLEDESHDKKDKKKLRDKEARSDDRGQRLLSQRIRNLKRQMECRIDINRLNAPFIAIYESLIPTEEQKAKEKQLFTLLERLVTKEWPKAQLFLYGSCANSFGVSKSDIDVCFVMEDADVNKSEVLLKLADILQSDNLQNVQALAHARVPIVKLMDPVTGISCDICINNVLAVVNTKLLRDYAQIDVRLRQLAFIVKHWAKSRGVNETYRGTLSSYAYVLMCIHFLQQRRPAILPCLQEMETTCSATVGNIECAFYDQVEKLRNFGSHNRETIAKLVWAFFNYWAYRHDYANAVISVRTGSILSKREKDWTRRIGNDRHLICIEDPFEVSHDLGRVVDKFTIKVLREEFERAADIMQYSPNPCVTLFEPYVPTSRVD